jgi:tetratricopeptide (TPR) repeat protein
MLAEIYRDKGDEDKASEIYDRLMKDNPGNPETQLSLCDFLLKQKKYDDLFSLLNIVVLNSKISREQKMELFTGLLDEKDIIDKYGEKIMLPVMVLEAANENDGIISLIRPELLSRLKKYDEAAERLEEIIKLYPDNYYAWEKLLLVYFDSGNFKKLQERGRECAIKFNRSFLAKVLYATGAVENKDYNTALEELKKANILAGNNKDLLLQVLTIKADVYYKMKDYEQAFKTFDEAISADNSDITLLNNYAYYLAEQDIRLKEAEKMSKEVIAKEPDNNTFLDTYGWILYKRGKLREAQKVFEKIIQSNENHDAEYFEHYGYIMEKRKNCGKAIENWNMALKLDTTKTELLNEIEKCRK